MTILGATDEPDHAPTCENLIGALTARNATLERVLGEVEDELSDIDGHLQGGDDPDFTDSLRLDAIMDNVDRLRTILAGVKETT